MSGVKLTTEQAIAQYGDVPLRFAGYYKYTFTFAGGSPDGARVVIGIGGDRDDIYKFNLTPETGFTLSDERHYFAQIKRGDEVVYDYYDAP